MREITTEIIRSFNDYLINEEKAQATIGKYLHDVGEFQVWLGEQELCKKGILAYKSYLCEHYAPASVNAALSSLNSFFNYMEWYDLRVKNLKIQKQIFASTDKELTKTEYDRLLEAAKQKKNERLYLLMQTMGDYDFVQHLAQYASVSEKAVGRKLLLFFCREGESVVRAPEVVIAANVLFAAGCPVKVADFE